MYNHFSPNSICTCHPTPIQAQALPIALSGNNMVGIGQTGSGKTLAFLLPAFLHIQKLRAGGAGNVENTKEGPKVVILAPTRELAKQIEEVARQWRNVTKMKTVCCIGGEGRFVAICQNFKFIIHFILQAKAAGSV